MMMMMMRPVNAGTTYLPLPSGGNHEITAVAGISADILQTCPHQRSCRSRMTSSSFCCRPTVAYAIWACHWRSLLFKTCVEFFWAICDVIDASSFLPVTFFNEYVITSDNKFLKWSSFFGPLCITMLLLGKRFCKIAAITITVSLGSQNGFILQ